MQHIEKERSKSNSALLKWISLILFHDVKNKHVIFIYSFIRDNCLGRHMLVRTSANTYIMHSESVREREKHWIKRMKLKINVLCLDSMLVRGKLEKLLPGLTAQSYSVWVRVRSWTHCQGICQSYRLSRLCGGGGGAGGVIECLEL